MSNIKELFSKLPRIKLSNLRPKVPEPIKRREKPIRGRERPRPNIKPRIGFAFDRIPFQKKIPKYGYYRDQHLKRQYFPFTLWQLQNMIDLGRIDPDQPIDINAIANSRVLKMLPSENNYAGVYLLSQGSNCFQAKVNIEVQIADDLAIAAVEKAGGVISTTFYDRVSFEELVDPVSTFMKGQPIRKRLLPPEELISYYTDPKKRGYLSDPALVDEERLRTSAQYGYELPDISKDESYEMLIEKKDPRQIYYGLMPGSLVNLYDRTVIKPNEDYVQEYLKA